MSVQPSVINLFIVLCVLTTGSSAETLPLIDSSQLRPLPASALELEHAATSEQLRWGLMQRTTLPANGGMLFHPRTPQKMRFWAFNTRIDLSVAFMDREGVIREIFPLPSHMEMMDPARPVFTLNDLRQYTPDDPAVQFFERNAVYSSFEADYALEVNLPWFESNGVQPGDVVQWQRYRNPAFVLHTLDIGKSAAPLPYALKLSGMFAHALWNPSGSEAVAVLFFDSTGNLVSARLLEPRSDDQDSHPPVVASNGPVKYAVVAPAEWLDKSGIRLVQSTEGQVEIVEEDE